MRTETGFTLLEVLIALLLSALALAALIRAAGNEARALEMTRDSTLAGWVASNVIAETRLAPGLPALGRRRGETEFARRKWHWELQIQTTEVAEIRRLEVQVFALGAKHPAAALSGFATP